MTAEAATGCALSWSTQYVAANLTISDWVVTEFASALSVKIRMHNLRMADRAKAAGAFSRLQTGSLMVVPLTRNHFRAAPRFAEQSALRLRTGDALHIAVAADLGFTVCTLDKRLAEAAVAAGVVAELV